MTNKITIQDAAAAVYRKYGANLAAFWRDAFAAEAQKHGDPVELHALDGNCIHYVPICHRCRLVTIDCHLKDKEAIRKEEREAVWSEVLDIANKHLDEPGFGYLLRNKLLEAAATEKKGRDEWPIPGHR